MQVLGVIPARGGSKGIPGKNLRMVGGQSLLAYTVNAVSESRLLTRVVLSTDDRQIAAAGRALGVDVPFMRPAALAADDTPMLPVLIHALAALDAEGFQAEAVVLLQPTSPLRRGTHIDAAIGLLQSSGADSVVSVVEVPHQFNPVSVMSLRDGRLRPFLEGPVVTRRQDKPPVFARNGPAVLVARTSVLQRGSLYGDDCRALVMTAEESLDVDSSVDLDLLDFLLAKQGRGRAAGESA
jgi:CMP-N,N'-diacetyllegionaminic acid synthase